MKMNKIVQIGDGMGSGDIVEAVARDTIESIIANADITDCWKMAYQAQNPGYQDGICCICLITGEIKSFAMSQNSRNQAIDNSYIELARVGQNEDDPFDVDDEQIEECIEAYEYDYDFPGLREGWDNLEWNSDRAKNINKEKWYEIFNDLRELNKDHFEPYENEFDWNSISEELDAFYNYE